MASSMEILDADTVGESNVPDRTVVKADSWVSQAGFAGQFDFCVFNLECL